MSNFSKAKNQMEGRLCMYTLLTTNLSKNPQFDLCTYLDKFTALKTNLDRMRFVYEDFERCKAYPPFKKDQKSDTEAISKREEGNVYYKEGKYRAALDCYTMSILTAESPRELALAYANRSAALLGLNLHNECLTDIERALKNGYKLKQKLIMRQTRCKAQKIIESRSYEPVPKFSESERNPQIQSAKNCVKIMKNQKYGRFVVATRDIQIGEILAIEAPYSAILEAEFYIYCHECFQLCYNLIPCDKCTKALYCGDNCKDKAFSAYHKYECPILSSLDLIQIDFPKRLALKTVLMAKNEWNTDTVEDDKVYCSDRFKEFHNLEAHAEKRTSQNLLARAALACGVFHLIKNHTSLLQEHVSEDRLKEIILLLMLICGTNTVGINELTPDEAGIYQLNAIITAVFSFFTLFSHSCCPNVSRHYHGSSMVLRAISSIKKGEQCFVEYGPHYVRYNKEFRQNFLRSHLFFTCTCRACEENWPLSTHMPVRKDWKIMEFFVMMTLAKADVDIAKNELPQLLVKAKEAEDSLPPGEDCIVKGLLKLCFDIFGNKRRI